MITENENISYLKNCKICGNANLKKVIKLEEQFISSTFVKSNKNNNLTKIRTPLNLVLCDKKKEPEACGHLQLYEIINPDLLYKEYFYRSATSDTMRKDLKKVVDKVLSLIEINSGDVIVDIGSNDCTLLNYYSNDYTLVGFEPAKNIKYIDKGKKIKIFSNYFNSKDFKKNLKKKAKIITSCAMFYDLPEPKIFVNDIQNILDDDGIWCVQISYLPSMIKNNNFYDICHEHLSYYSIDVFERLINEFKLKTFYAETNEVNGGSIRLFVCKEKCKKFEKNEFLLKLETLKNEERKFRLKSEDTFFDFQKKIEGMKNKTNKFVDSIIGSNKKIIALGASTKGNILLQHFGLNKNKIPFISERNLVKVGLKCLGSDIELISEESARKMNPAAMIVLPWSFKEEIVKREKKYIDNGGQLMFPMPYPHLITKKGEIKL